MSTKIWVAVLGISLVVLPGCCNGPCRQFFRGGACNTCMPWLGRAQQDECSDRYDGVSYPGDEHCPNCATGDVMEGMAPGGDIVFPEGVITTPQFQIDPYSAPATVPSDGLNNGVLPRPR